jgi:hypothetical protein
VDKILTLSQALPLIGSDKVHRSWFRVEGSGGLGRRDALSNAGDNGGPSSIVAVAHWWWLVEMASEPNAFAFRG